MNETLASLAEKYGTDKGFAGVKKPHGYVEHYERLLCQLRDKPVTILEIGVASGASLRMWRDYFPQGQIVGIDVQPKCKEQESERIKVRIGNSIVTAFNQQVIQEIGKPDMVIDDGSHRSLEQLPALNSLFPMVKDQGIYVIEDLQVQGNIHYGGDDSTLRCVNELSAWLMNGTRPVLCERLIPSVLPLLNGIEVRRKFVVLFRK